MSNIFVSENVIPASANNSRLHGSERHMGSINMKDVPFEIVDWKNDPHWMAKSFFNYVYEQKALIPVLDKITQRHGYSYNDEFCFFPDISDPDPVYHFEGVMFGVGDEEIIITEAQCWTYVCHVAEFYASRHGADAAKIESFLRRIEH